MVSLTRRVDLRRVDCFVPGPTVTFLVADRPDFQGVLLDGQVQKINLGSISFFCLIDMFVLSRSSCYSEKLAKDAVDGEGEDRSSPMLQLDEKR